MNFPISNSGPLNNVKKKLLEGYTVFPGGVDGVSGSESQALAFFRNYDREKFLVDLVLLGLNRSFIQEGEKVENLNLVCLAERNMSPMNPHIIWKLGRVLREGRYDFVHLYGLRQELVSRPLAKIVGRTKVVSAIRGMESHRGLVPQLLNRMTGIFVDIWISNSHQTKDLFVLRDGLPADRVLVIPNGVEVPYGSAVSSSSMNRARKAMGLSTAGFVVGCVANHLPAKRQEDLISAVRIMKDRGIEAHAVLFDVGGSIPSVFSNDSRSWAGR